MQVFVFEGRQIQPGRAYGFACDKDGDTLPAQFGPWSSHGEIDLATVDRSTTMVNVGEALANILRQGFHIQATATSVRSAALVPAL